MHVVAVVAMDGVVPFDLSTPCEVFGCVRLPGGRAGYQVRVCGVTREVSAGAFDLRLRCGLDELTRADTVILPGIADASVAVPEALLPVQPGELVATVYRLARKAKAPDTNQARKRGEFTGRRTNTTIQ
ncbi:hypothetical protein BE11_19855 [Sorangium cellulosum]|nr:hypothetical protein BE11_19855 [Sorangium cellulosum]